MASQPRSVQSSRWDGAIFLIIPRHFVPGYYHAVPPGQKTLDRRGLLKLASMVETLG
jgi:hypothetical protein